jgi:hypothetical protein
MLDKDLTNRELLDLAAKYTKDDYAENGFKILKVVLKVLIKKSLLDDNDKTKLKQLLNRI